MIRDILTGKTISEKVDIITDEIVSKSRKDFFTSGKLQLEIIDLIKIPKGVQVQVRTWSDGAQVGFGKDGSVDIERINIYYPNFEIETPDGIVVQSGIRMDGVPYEIRTKEDPEQALLNDILHTLRVKKEFFVGSSKIITGKLGNTTSTFNSVSGATSPCDGSCINAPGSSSWATVQGASAGTSASAVDTNGNPYTRLSGANYSISRPIWNFDTSDIPDSDIISSATFSVYVESTNIGDADANAFIRLTTATPASTSDVVTGDFDQAGSTTLGTDKTISSITSSAYADWALNAAGISHISKTGVTSFATREGHDVNNDPITTGWNYIIDRAADSAGGTPPKLVVEHSFSEVSIAWIRA